MNKQSPEQESLRAYQLMNELEGNELVSQRELAGRLGIAVGLVNSYLKNFVAKGYVRVKNYPRNRYAYLLTPKGFAEKSRLAYQHISYFNNLFSVVRNDYLQLFVQLRDEGCQQVVFCGADEAAEVAYLSLREVGLDLTMVIEQNSDKDFFGYVVQPIVAVTAANVPIVLTSLKRREVLYNELLMLGVPTGMIRGIGQD